MKRLIFTIVTLFISTYFCFGSTWEIINEKTWISNKDFPTSQYVFYQTSNGLKKAIFQINGSGRCAVLSVIYDVDLNGDAINLKNELPLESLKLKKGITNKNILSFILKDDSTLISEDFTYEYKKSFKYARICNWIETYSDNEIIPIEDLKRIPIKENQIYDIHSFNIGPNPEKCGIDNKPELTESEAFFLNKYLKISAQKNGFDFRNKKILFVTGSSGNTLGSKNDYFKDVKEWKEKYNEKIATSLWMLNDSEKLEYGYDAIVTYWVKVYNPKRKKVLEKTKSN